MSSLKNQNIFVPFRMWNAGRAGLGCTGWCVLFFNTSHKVIRSASGGQDRGQADNIPKTPFARTGYLNTWAIRELAKIIIIKSLKGNIQTSYPASLCTASILAGGSVFCTSLIQRLNIANAEMFIR